VNNPSHPTAASYRDRLRSLMQAANISSLKALSQAAGVSLWQVKQLSQGRATQMRVQSLYKLSQALQISIADLLSAFSELPIGKSAIADPLVAESKWEQECQRLQAQLAEQSETLRQDFQQTMLRSLESWLIQFPTLIYAAQQNPQFPAKNFLPFIRPLEQLLQDWGIEAIAPVGAEVGYDPQIHQLMEGTAQIGDRVKVRYIGYRQGEKLLYRAKVGRVV
jgi:DNA-binding Xre family transcriptional regulator